MSVTINVTGENAAEVLKDLREISGALLASQALAAASKEVVATVDKSEDVEAETSEEDTKAEETAAAKKAAAKKKADAAAAKKKADAEKKKAEEEAAATAEDIDEEESQYTLAEVRKKATEIIKLGLKDEVQGLIASLGFEGLSKVTPDKFGEVMTGLEELEALA